MRRREFIATVVAAPAAHVPILSPSDRLWLSRAFRPCSVSGGEREWNRAHPDNLVSGVGIDGMAELGMLERDPSAECESGPKMYTTTAYGEQIARILGVKPEP